MLPDDAPYRITHDAVSVLVAKTYLLKKDYAQAATAAKSLLQSGKYQLLPNVVDVFKNADNSEVIWDISGKAANLSMFTTYFAKGAHCPVARLVEMYLTAAEGLLESEGVTPEMISYLNILYERKGYPDVINPSMTTGEARQLLRTTWQQEMVREGVRFACLQRWGAASDPLGQMGYISPRNDLLPIPQIFLERYPGLSPNPGY